MPYTTFHVVPQGTPQTIVPPLGTSQFGLQTPYTMVPPQTGAVRRATVDWGAPGPHTIAPPPSSMQPQYIPIPPNSQQAQMAEYPDQLPNPLTGPPVDDDDEIPFIVAPGLAARRV